MVAQHSSKSARTAALDLARPGWILDTLFVLSIWNLNLMRGWRAMIFATSAEHFWMPLPQTVDYLALLILVCGGAFVSLLVLRCIRRYGSRLENILFLVFAGAISIGIVDYLRDVIGLVTFLYVVAGSTPLILGLVIWQRSRTLLAQVVFVGGLVMVPFAVSNMLQAAWHIVGAKSADVQPDGAENAATTALAISHQPTEGSGHASRHRVVWLLFDELDERALFGDRRSGYRFETFDQFRGQSVHFGRVTGAGGLTPIAMPSLWLGTRVTNSESVDADTLLVTLEGTSSAVPLDDLDHLFRATHDAGLHTALVGYFFPYCRIFKGYYDSCETFYYLNPIDPRTAESRSLGEALAAQTSAFNPMWTRVIKIEEFQRSVKAAAAAAADERFDLVAIHSGFPHGPWVFDARRKQYSLLKNSYIDNIALADRYLELIRQAMQDSGLWNRTAIIITADHGLRSWQGTNIDTVGAVPFLVKLPFQQHGRDVSCNFDVIVLRTLIEELLRGSVPSDQSLDVCLIGRPVVPL
jgi:hypothetical protein